MLRGKVEDVVGAVVEDIVVLVGLTLGFVVVVVVTVEVAIVVVLEFIVLNEALGTLLFFLVSTI